MLSDFFIYVRYQGSINSSRAAEKISLLREFADLEHICDDDAGDSTHFTDAALSDLSSLAKLRYLSMRNTPITDAGMETIAQFSKLHYLDLSGTRITSRGFRCLKVMPLLSTLNLNFTAVDDDAAETISRLDGLTELSVLETKLTDKSVPYLSRLSRLRHLYISAKYITENGFQELRSKLPNCEISLCAGMGVESQNVDPIKNEAEK